MRVAALALVHDRAHAVAGDRAGDEHDVAAVAEPRDALAAERERLDRAARARRRAAGARDRLAVTVGGGGAARRVHARRASTQQLEQRLLRVAAVLGLVPDALARAVEDLGGDLLAGVRRQVVHRERARRGGVEQRVVDAVVGERAAALLGGVLVAHAHPHVGVDRARARDRLARVRVAADSAPLAPAGSGRSSSSA